MNRLPVAERREQLIEAALAVASANLERSLGDLLEEATSTESVIENVIDALWAGIQDSRGPQLLSYELTTSSLRHPELNQVAIEQYRGQWAAAEQVLDLVERAAGVGWAVPRAKLARSIVAVVAGFSLAWLVGGDSETARLGLQGFGRFLATMAVPAALAPDELEPAPTTPA